MAEWTEAERFLLEQIRRGDTDAWSQLVERYQGRLLAFARSRGIKGADAEDLVQDTFLLFLRGLAGFRGQASLETYLFVILRRRVIEHFRGKQTSLCRMTEPLDAGEQPSSIASPTPAASWYARRDEKRDQAKASLGIALKALTDRLRNEPHFRDLQMLELLFYAQARNKDIAAMLQVDEQNVALQKHRWLKSLRQLVDLREAPCDGGSEEGASAATSLDSLLTEVWQELRPTCAKRSTIGGYFLGTLDEPWQQYLTFHIERLGCAFCRANLEDLQRQTEEPAALRSRILQSTVGFLSRREG
jgi:RNA polymerase sigma-70 factor, ECF subfamily